LSVRPVESNDGARADRSGNANGRNAGNLYELPEALRPCRTLQARKRFLPPRSDETPSNYGQSAAAQIALQGLRKMAQ
jgi:hypothetical protein